MGNDAVQTKCTNSPMHEGKFIFWTIPNAPATFHDAVIAGISAVVRKRLEDDAGFYAMCMEEIMVVVEREKSRRMA
jgi:hypothetical protein